MVKILQYLKRTEDATPVPATPYIHTVCDLALALAPAVLQAYAPGAEAGGNFPGTVPLPSAFYRRADHASATGQHLEVAQALTCLGCLALDWQVMLPLLSHVAPVGGPEGGRSHCQC